MTAPIETPDQVDALIDELCVSPPVALDLPDTAVTQVFDQDQPDGSGFTTTVHRSNAPRVVPASTDYPIGTGLVAMLIGGPTALFFVTGIPRFVADWMNAGTSGWPVIEFGPITIDIPDIAAIEPGPWWPEMRWVLALLVITTCVALMFAQALAIWSDQQREALLDD